MVAIFRMAIAQGANDRMPFALYHTTCLHQNKSQYMHHTLEHKNNVEHSPQMSIGTIF